MRWTTITYPHPILDPATGAWISRAEVAESTYTAFSSKKQDHQVTGRLVVRRIPDANAARNQTAGKGTLFDLWRFHAFFTTTPTGAAGQAGQDGQAKATTATIRRTLIHVPARVASSARRLALHLPTAWPWERAWTEPVHQDLRPPVRDRTDLTTPAGDAATRAPTDPPDSGAGRSTTPSSHPQPTSPIRPSSTSPSVE